MNDIRYRMSAGRYHTVRIAAGRRSGPSNRVLLAPETVARSYTAAGVPYPARRLRSYYYVPRRPDDDNSKLDLVLL